MLGVRFQRFLHTLASSNSKCMLAVICCTVSLHVRLHDLMRQYQRTHGEQDPNHVKGAKDHLAVYAGIHSGAAAARFVHAARPDAAWGEMPACLGNCLSQSSHPLLAWDGQCTGYRPCRGVVRLVVSQVLAWRQLVSGDAGCVALCTALVIACLNCNTLHSRSCTAGAGLNIPKLGQLL